MLGQRQYYVALDDADAPLGRQWQVRDLSADEVARIVRWPAIRFFFSRKLTLIFCCVGFRIDGRTADVACQHCEESKFEKCRENHIPLRAWDFFCEANFEF